MRLALTDDNGREIGAWELPVEIGLELGVNLIGQGHAEMRERMAGARGVASVVPAVRDIPLPDEAYPALVGEGRTVLSVVPDSGESMVRVPCPNPPVVIDTEEQWADMPCRERNPHQHWSDGSVQRAPHAARDLDQT